MNHNSLTPRKRLTYLGAFDELLFIHWHENYLYPFSNVGQGTYILNVENGEIEKYFGPRLQWRSNYNPHLEMISPDGRIGTYTTDYTNLLIFDFKTAKNYELPMHPKVFQFLLTKQYALARFQITTRPWLNIFCGPDSEGSYCDSE